MTDENLAGINYLTEEQYNAAKAEGSIKSNELYLTPDTELIAPPVIPTIGDNGNWYVNGTDTTKPSKGTDGFSPTAKVTKEGTTATITITDKTGTTTTTITDGAKGDKGDSASKFLVLSTDENTAISDSSSNTDYAYYWVE